MLTGQPDRLFSGLRATFPQTYQDHLQKTSKMSGASPAPSEPLV
jgi:hypothetical protein